MKAAPGEDKTPLPGSFSELWRVALPLVLSSGSVSLMFVVDRIFLTWSSRDAIAAAMPAGICYWMIIGTLLGTVTYVNTFVAQYEGAGRKARVVASVWQGVYLSVIGGALLLAFMPFSGLIFALVGHAPAVQKLETAYFSILCLGAVPMILSTGLSAFYSGRGKTLVVMYVNFGMSILNMVLDYLFIFGVGPLPEWGIERELIPASGIHGAATATVIAQYLGVIAYFVLMVREHKRENGYPILHHRRFDRELFGRLLRYGLPTGLQYLSDIAGFAIFIFLIGRIGTNQGAASAIAFNLNSMAFVPMFGFGTAVAILVGKRIGEGKPELAVRSTWLAARLCAIYMLSFAAVYLFFPDWIIAPFAAKSSPEEFAPLRELIVDLLKFVAVYSFFDGLAIIFGSATRGAGDTRFSMIFSFATGWLLMVLPTYAVWKWVDAKLFWSWTACTIYIVTVGIGFLIRFQMGNWKSMRVIEAADEDDPSADDREAGDDGPGVGPQAEPVPIAPEDRIQPERAAKPPSDQASKSPAV